MTIRSASWTTWANIQKGFSISFKSSIQRSFITGWHKILEIGLAKYVLWHVQIHNYHMVHINDTFVLHVFNYLSCTVHNIIHILLYLQGTYIMFELIMYIFVQVNWQMVKVLNALPSVTTVWHLSDQCIRKYNLPLNFVQTIAEPNKQWNCWQ